MTSQAGQHIIIMLILPNFKKSKGNQAMKFDPVERLVKDPFLFFKKVLYKLKAIY